MRNRMMSEEMPDGMTEEQWDDFCREDGLQLLWFGMFASAMEAVGKAIRLGYLDKDWNHTGMVPGAGSYNAPALTEGMEAAAWLRWMMKREQMPKVRVGVFIELFSRRNKGRSKNLCHARMRDGGYVDTNSQPMEVMP
jgi:hypothetical protein